MPVTAGDARPNILVFMTDQQHHATVGGDLPCRTPHLDRFMARATRFTHAFTPTPICTPARASCQTGLLPHQHRLAHNTHRDFHLIADLAPGTPTLGSLLTGAGYQTAYLGKWHVGRTLAPTDHGYQRYLNPSSGRPTDLTDVISLNPDDPRCTIAATTTLSAEETEPFRIARETARLIGDMAKQEQPFFLFASTVAPHVPWICPQPYAAQYEASALAPWPNYQDDLSDKPLSYRRHYNKMNACRMPDQWPRVASALTRYYGLVTLIDEAFGQMLDALAAAGCLENTLVVFTTDHGEMLGRHGLVGKDDQTLDDITRIPLVMSRPGQTRGEVCDRFVSLTDLFATCLDAAGMPAEVSRGESRSLFGAEAFPDEAFIEHHGSMFFNAVRAIRTREFLYVFRPHEIDELYDLRDDSWQVRNRIDDPAYAPALDNLRARLIARMERTGDPAARGARSLLCDAPQAIPLCQ